LSGTICSVYKGKYSEYAIKKQQLLEAKIHAYENQQKIIRHQEEVIQKLRSFNREKSIRRAESREKMLEKIQVQDRPYEEKSNLHLTLSPRVVSGKDVLNVHGLSKRYDNQILFENIDFEIKRGEHVAIIGDNGTGKTTLLKILNSLVLPDAGTAVLGTKVEIGYYDQEHHVLHAEKNLFDEISDEYPDLGNTQIRNVLAAFLFLGDDVFQLIETLSGGERGRLSLAKLMLSYANFLILDEPTNHLDIASKEILENALNQYEGTILYVSHDRYFINKTAHRILELRGGNITLYLGNYDYYLEKRQPSYDLTADEAILTPHNASQTKRDWLEQKETAAKRRKLASDLKTCEDRITQLEKDKAETISIMSQEESAADYSKLSALSATLQQIEEDLERLYPTWEELFHQVEVAE
jgi:ATP-binding cassette subfamily F protein 3